MIHLDAAVKQMSFSKLKLVIPYILSSAAILIFIDYLLRNAERFKELLDLSIGSLFLLAGLVLVTLVANGLLNYLLYQDLGAPATFNESIGLAAVNTLANLLPFTGGMMAKGVYLKKKYELAYTRFLSATLALYVCFVAANGVIGSMILAYWTLSEGFSIPVPLILAFLGMVVSLIVFWIPINVPNVSGKWKKRLARLLSGWHVLRHNQSLIIKLVGVQLFMTLIFAGRFWIAFHILSQEVSLMQCILFAAATILTRLVSITPGALGIREAIVAAIAAVLGFEVDVSIIAVGIDRLVATFVIIVVGTVYTYVLSRQVINDSLSISDS